MPSVAIKTAEKITNRHKVLTLQVEGKPNKLDVRARRYSDGEVQLLITPKMGRHPKATKALVPKSMKTLNEQIDAWGASAGVPKIALKGIRKHTNSYFGFLFSKQ